MWVAKVDRKFETDDRRRAAQVSYKLIVSVVLRTEFEGDKKIIAWRLV
jgi:hypothetical protein